jgi:hypothetical protein
MKIKTYRLPLLASRSSSHLPHLPILPGFQLCRHLALQPLLLPAAYLFLGIPSRWGAGDVEHYAPMHARGSCLTDLI